MTFASWRSYWDFKREVIRARRFMPSAEAAAFLETLAATAASRVRRIPSGKRFCRAQVAHAERDDPHAGPLPGPALPERMMPRPDAASEGRANPEGIPRLYMADNRHTAIAEVRPWIGSIVSVAMLQTTRDLTVVDCRSDRGGTMFYESEPDGPEREVAVWKHVAAAFREPVLRGDDRAGYAATQIIAELFEREGYDGIAYGSGFGTNSTNVVLFDIAAAEITSCEIHEVRGVTLDHSEIDNPYHVERRDDGSRELYRVEISAVGPVGGPLIDLATGEEIAPEVETGEGSDNG